MTLYAGFYMLSLPIQARMVAYMTVVKAHFDGKVLIPDEPVKLPVDCALELHIQPVEKGTSAPAHGKPLLKLLRALEDLPANPDWPEDGAAQHDHYLYASVTSPPATPPPCRQWR